MPQKLSKILSIALALACTLFAALMVWKMAFIGLVLLVAIPCLILFLFLLYQYPKLGIYLVLAMSFFVTGLGRYVSGIPFGLSIDGLIILVLLIAILKSKKEDSHKVNNVLMASILVWFIYTFMELFNPEAVSKVAWFYAVRGVSLYFVLFTPGILLLFNRKKDYDWFIKIWLGLATYGALWGCKQYFLGMDPYELAWLHGPGSVTHFIFGNVRIFSFFSDAGQFGAVMAHACLVAGILGLRPQPLKYRALYFGIALLCFYAMMISGTRGALFVIAAGGLVYLFISKNFKILMLGVFVAAGAFYFLKFTTVAQGNYNVRRLRSALDPKDASLQMRLINQRKLKTIMKDLPIGGGIGSGGSWGLRFSPHTKIAQIPYDSWYVKIWVETGVIGLLLHIAHILLILALGMRSSLRIRDPDLKQKVDAVVAGIAGVAVASYGNQVFGQVPTVIIMYLGIAFVYVAPKFDLEASKASENEQKLKL